MRHSIHRHIHHHHYHRNPSGRSERPWRRGRRRYDDIDAVIAFLEERQRDLEQAAADVAAKVQRLKERRDARTASTPEGAATEGTPPEGTAFTAEGAADPAAPTGES